jgi:hypothetical protein
LIFIARFTNPAFWHLHLKFDHEWRRPKQTVVNTRLWPRAGAPSINFVATLLTAVLHPQRLLWSRQIEQSSDRTQSEAVVQFGRVAVGNAA